MSYKKLGFKSGQTLKAEHLNHIEEGIESLSAGGVSSWNDLTDRPFYKEVSEVVLLEEQSVTTADDGEGNIMAELPPIFDGVSVGSKVCVTLDGENYDCVVDVMTVDPINEVECRWVGNPAFLGGADNDMPFIIAGVYFKGTSDQHNIITPEPRSFSLEIVGEAETVVPIPKEYLPTAEIVFTLDGSYGSEVPTVTCNKTLEELMMLPLEELKSAKVTHAWSSDAEKISYENVILGAMEHINDTLNYRAIAYSTLTVLGEATYKIIINAADGTIKVS